MLIVGIAALLISGVGIAMHLVKETELVLLRTRALLELLTVTRDCVEMYSMSGSAILRNCAPELLARCGYPSVGIPPESFEKMAFECDIPDVRSRESFCEFARDFGKGYRKQETQRCEHCIERLRERELELAAELPAKRKSIWSVSLCATLIGLILLL